MALDAIKKEQGLKNGLSTSANWARVTNAFSTSALDDADPQAQGQSNSHKLVFFTGNNIAAHYVLREAIEAIGDHNIPCDLYLTEVLPKSDDLREKLSRPETKNAAFFEKLMINHGYDVIEKFDAKEGMQLNSSGELRSNLQYSPNQLHDYYATKGVAINVIDMTDTSQPVKDRDINDADFVKKIHDDTTIARAYNLRSMQILKRPLIKAFENKFMNGHQSRIINAHPGDVVSFPGTNIAFWARMKKSFNNVWTLHVIDEGIDTGDFLDRTSKVLKSGKSLLQDMLTMATPAASMIVNDVTMFFAGSPRMATPQNKNLKPAKNYTYATHDEWLDAHKNKIHFVKPQTYINALAMEYTGSMTSERSIELQRALATATLDWQNNYLSIYQAQYNTHPPDYDPNNPGAYFVQIPPPYKPPAHTNTNIGPSHP